MTAEEYLEQYQNNRRRVDRLKVEILERKKIVEDIARYRYPKKVRPTIQEDIDQIIEGISQLKKTKDLYKAECEAVEETISKVDGIEGEVLRYRYIEGMKWPAIIDKTFYSNTGIYKIHVRGLEMLEAVINDLEPQSEAHISS